VKHVQVLFGLGCLDQAAACKLPNLH